MREHISEGLQGRRSAGGRYWSQRSLGTNIDQGVIIMSRICLSSRYSRRIAAILAIGGTVLVLASPLAAATTKESAPTPPASGHSCVVSATSFVRHGEENVVTAASETCYPSSTPYLANLDSAARNTSSPLSNVEVGYGCDLKNFSKSDTCWHFAVPSPGCTSSADWVWNQLGAMNNDMQSWKSLNSCKSGVVFSQPSQTGSHVTCDTTCNSLGVVNNHDESLLARFAS